MNIVNFTPISALSGGLLIGLSVALFFILKGRMIGVSGMASNFLISKENRTENLFFFGWVDIRSVNLHFIFRTRDSNYNFKFFIFINWGRNVSWFWNKIK